jgi:benzylsuccinate CoA-transferase BbsF subunit
MPAKPLEGIKICDFCWVFVGPQTTKLLADCGADVIRVESNNRPGLWRTAPPFKDNVPGLNRAGAFAYFNTSKRSVTVNLAHPKGKELVKKLISWADVVTENYAGGVMEKMGLGYEDIRQIKPDIIMMSSCMQGQTGPYANHPGYGTQLSALSGFSHISGWPDREPADIGYYTDTVAPLFNVLAIMAAIDYRRRTGKGQYLDLSQLEGGANFMAPSILDYEVNQRSAVRLGNRSFQGHAPYGIFRCKGDDRWTAIAVTDEDEWRSLAAVMGDAEWTKDARFHDAEARLANSDELEKLIEAWTCRRPAEEVMTLLQSAGVAAGVLQTGEDLLEHDPQLAHRGFFRQLEHPEIESYHGLSPSFRFSKTPHELKRAPLIGEHNEEVFTDILGLTGEEIAELIIEGAIE